MKKTLLIACLVSFGMLECFAQQVPLYTNYNFNLLGINPAVAGTQPCLDLRMGQRRQWTGIDGAPLSNYLLASGSFGKKRFNFHGAGIHVENDEAGRFGQLGMKAVYAYHMRVNRRNMLSMGLSLGFNRIVFDSGGLILNDQEDINASQPQFLFPLIGAGFWYQSQDRFIGLSFKNLIQNRLDNIGTDSRYRTHTYLIMGKSISVDDNLFFKPSVNFRYISGSPIAADLNLVFDLNDVFEFGIAARSGHGISGLVKVGVLKYLTIGYAYDRTLNKLRLAGANTHEIMLGIRACPRGGSRGIKCSAYD